MLLFTELLAIRLDNNPLSKERSLLDIEEVKNDIIQVAPSHGFNLFAQKKDEESYYVSSESGNGFVVSRGDSEIFTVELQRPEGEQRELKIIISNLSIEQRFMDFNENHFDIRMGIDPTKEKDPGTLQEVNNFLSNAVLTIKDRLQFLDNKGNPGEKVVAALKKYVKGASFSHIDIPQSLNAENNLKASEIHATSSDKKKVIRFLLAPSVSGIYNFILVDSPEFFQVNFHINKVDDVISHAALYINNIINSELRNSIPLASYFERLEAAIKGKNCEVGGGGGTQKKTNTSNSGKSKSKPGKSSKGKPGASKPKNTASKSRTGNNSFHIKAFDFTLSEKADCKLNGHVISGVAYRINELSGFHLKSESDYLIQEYIIALDENFDKNLENVIKEITTENADLKDSINKNKGGSIITETMDSINKAISGLAKGNIACEAPKADSFTCTLTIGKQKFVIVKVIERSKKEDFFQISLIDPPKTNSGKSTGFAHPEIFISKYNGYNQNERLVNQIKPFFEKVQKFKISRK